MYKNLTYRGLLTFDRSVCCKYAGNWFIDYWLLLVFLVRKEAINSDKKEMNLLHESWFQSFNQFFNELDLKP